MMMLIWFTDASAAIERWRPEFLAWSAKTAIAPGWWLAGIQLLLFALVAQALRVTAPRPPRNGEAAIHPPAPSDVAAKITTAPRVGADLPEEAIEILRSTDDDGSFLIKREESYGGEAVVIPTSLLRVEFVSVGKPLIRHNYLAAVDRLVSDGLYHEIESLGLRKFVPLRDGWILLGRLCEEELAALGSVAPLPSTSHMEALEAISKATLYAAGSFLLMGRVGGLFTRPAWLEDEIKQCGEVDPIRAMEIHWSFLERWDTEKTAEKRLWITFWGWRLVRCRKILRAIQA